jgi:Domain of Unknown Function (DUF1080)
MSSFMLIVAIGNLNTPLGFAQSSNNKSSTIKDTELNILSTSSSFPGYFGYKKIDDSISIKNYKASKSCDNQNLSDNFNSDYILEEGQTSPNGKWKNVYSGFGTTGVEESEGSHIFFLRPGIANSTDETEAALVQSANSFCNFVVDFDIKTVKQLRQNSDPNEWEAGWFFFRYTDTFHYYWFLIGSDVAELGKKDCNSCTNSVDGQQFLVTQDFPTLHLNKWMHWKISAIGNHIQISVDGNKVIDFIDKTMSPKLSAGNIAMYSEDAYVRYDNMNLITQ